MCIEKGDFHFLLSSTLIRISNMAWLSALRTRVKVLLNVHQSVVQKFAISQCKKQLFLREFLEIIVNNYGSNDRSPMK